MAAPVAVVPRWPGKKEDRPTIPSKPVEWWGQFQYLAKFQCPRCWGLGVLRNGPCQCVLRAAFRECHRLYCAIKERGVSPAVPSRFEQGRWMRVYWSRPSEEFTADFVNIARRYLSPFDFFIFRLRFICMVRERDVLRICQMDHINRVYRVMEIAGKAYAACGLLEAQVGTMSPGFFQRADIDRSVVAAGLHGLAHPMHDARGVGAWR